MHGDLPPRPPLPSALLRRPVSRRGFLAGTLLGGGLLGLGLAGCSGPPAPTAPSPSLTPVPLGPSWAPKPATIGGLRCLATQEGETIRLHTVSGDATFWSGINLGSTTPGHSPGELAITAEDYRRWFGLMRDAGVRVLRIYTIHPPHMYQVLAEHNEANPEHPLYLVHGIYLPNESYLDSHDLFSAESTEAMVEEVRDASAAVHGTLRRAPVQGRASGTWSTDVSRWLAGWIVGVEWDPVATDASDRLNADRPAHRGTYFSSGPQATPTERWIAARMDELAGYEAAAGISVPMALANWPTTDPLTHPDEPLEREDLVGVDANHVIASDAWPGGTFASYHAYPYYPDFQRWQPSYRNDPSGDPYRAYLQDLKRHHAGMPLLVTEFGVPSSLGSAHIGTLGRDQGHHTEPQAMGMNADMLRMFKEIGLGGGMLFAWNSEWFKFTWNTLPRHAVVDSERRSLWHDVLTNEQHFGLLADDPVRAGQRTVHEAREGLTAVVLDHDASWVHLTLAYSQPLDAPVTLGFDIVPGAGLGLPGLGAQQRFDVEVRCDPVAGTARTRIRAELDPLLLDGLPDGSVPAPDPDGWRLQRMTLNRPFPARGAAPAREAELLDIGNLVRADDAAALSGTTGDTLSTWAITPAGDDGLTRIHLRMPWGLLALGDPSSLTAVVPKNKLPQAVQIERIAVAVAGGNATATTPVAFDIRWEGWNKAVYTERIKTGAQTFADALAQTSMLG
ncbi:hypothetical protein BJY21_000750 [Kineosphaera limosa]|uniref:Uncharacterized protein n=1 Tax=Kineosphaera limosa NBRC 100340 TaxID=1184609 RepID=K6VHJ7_9MICO|nr:twin-arginine translocation signal domain-containing protein [Kineosphaera limosa]NYD99565.1 hypothetical protein [Kineosphaera limosa]GAB95678.1 hypothetical protein KILIM_025_00150 [Kineosphaera limosa NBRC 100340]